VFHVVQLEEACRAAVVALLCRVHRAEGAGSFAHHGNPGEADALDFRIADPNALRLPALTIALDVDVAVPIGAPRMHGNEKAVPGVAVARLQLPADVTGEQIARDMRCAVEG